jgi:hypothetical protein
MENADVVVKPLKDFAKNSIRLVKRCTKPDRKGEAAAQRVHSHAIRSTVPAEQRLHAGSRCLGLARTCPRSSWCSRGVCWQGSCGG